MVNLVLRPYQYDLVNDTRKAFASGYKKPLVVLPCGAGKTVCFADIAHKHIDKNTKNKVWFLVHRRELIDQTLATFELFGIPTDNIFLGMVQTISRNPGKYGQPTLIIFDEAHHAKAKSWTNIVDHFKDVPMIGLTATPQRMDGKPLGDIFDKLIEGVESEWLMDNGYLAKYEYYAPPVTDMEFKYRGIDFDLDEFSAQLFKSKVYGDIKKYVDHTRKTIIYSPSIEFSKALCKEVGAVHFDGTTPKSERKQIVNDFKSGKIRVLSNVNLIGEGFDVPDCDTVILLRPTLSLSLYIQQSMRCLRPSPNKKAIIYDLVGNVYRHGMPTEKRDWKLTQKNKIRNKSGEPDIVVRQCKKCYLIYSGTEQECPYCGNFNGQTRRQIEVEQEIELKLIEKLNRTKSRQVVGQAKGLEDLIQVGLDRGYKNPKYWAKMVMSNRKRRI